MNCFLWRDALHCSLTFIPPLKLALVQQPSVQFFYSLFLFPLRHCQPSSHINNLSQRSCQLLTQRVTIFLPAFPAMKSHCQHWPAGENGEAASLLAALFITASALTCFTLLWSHTSTRSELVWGAAGKGTPSIYHRFLFAHLLHDNVKVSN